MADNKGLFQKNITSDAFDIPVLYNIFSWTKHCSHFPSNCIKQFLF
jgi:hypothetical protein